MKEILRIGYDPIHNFYESYHGEIVASTNSCVKWNHAKVINYFEESLRSTDTAIRRKFISAGELQCKEYQNLDWVFSPHLLIPDTNQDLPSIFMELEDIPWLFADTYDETIDDIPQEKLSIFCKSIMNPRLKHILWWSDSAIQRFFDFASRHKIDDEVQDRVTQMSSIIYPTAPVIPRQEKNTSRNQFCAVFNQENFYRKGGDIVLSVFSKLQQETKNWHLTIVGGIPISHSEFISENISVIAPVERNQLQQLFAQSNFFVFPSRADTFGTVIIEAVNTNCFVISSSGSSVIASKECLQDYPNSLLIPSPHNDGVYDQVDEEGFYQAIRKLVSNPAQLYEYNTPYTRAVTKRKLLSLLSGKESECL